MKIRSRLLPDVLNDLPDIERLEMCVEDDDVFIAVLGFEERALSVPRALASSKYRCRTALYIQYENPSVDNSVNLGGLISALTSISIVSPISISDSDISGRIRGHILPLASATNRELMVSIDLSGASIALVMKAMKVLLDLPVSLRLFYTEADVYYPRKEDFLADPQKWLSDDSLKSEVGVNSVYVCPDYPGQHYVPLPHNLIVVPSFNAARTKAMLAAIDEGLLTGSGGALIWLLGVPHLAENQWRCQALIDINEIETTSAQFEVSSFDYKEMMRVLEQVREGKWKTHNLTIAMLGSKLQAIGASLFCQIHPEIRVMVSSPLKYKSKRYSEGERALWQIRLGSALSLRGKLLSCGELQIEPI